jgi:hypothetical protein
MMNPSAILISQPLIDFDTFIGLSHKMLGRSPAISSDACRRNLSDTERFLSCLAAMCDEKAPVGFSANLLAHASFSILVAADERDMLDILQLAPGMPFVTAETLARGVLAAVITGTLGQWRDAVKSGSSPTAEPSVRYCFNKIYGLFNAVGLNVWGDLRSREAPDRTFYLEDKRRQP